MFHPWPQTDKQTALEKLQHAFDRPEHDWSQRLINVFLLIGTLFSSSKEDKPQAPERYIYRGHPSSNLLRYLRIYGDDVFLYMMLIVVFGIWMVANFTRYALYARYRWFSILVTALLIILTTEQWKAIPHRWLSRRVEKKQRIRMSTITWVYSVSTTLPGSLFELKSKKIFLLPFIVLLTHGPDLFAGTLTQVKKSGSNGIMRTVEYRLGPVAGGHQKKFFQSGLKFFTRDTEEEDKLAIEFKRGDIKAYMPHMPQDLYTKNVGLSFINAKDVPTYMIQSLDRKTNPKVIAEGEICSNSQKDDSPVFSMAAETTGDCIDMHLKYEQASVGKTEDFDDVIEICLGIANIEMERTELGPILRKVSDFRRNGTLGDIDRIQNNNHDMCLGFQNILSFGIEDARKEVQVIRVAAAWWIRSATLESQTGYLAEKFLKGQSKGTISQLRYKLPNWADWLIVILVCVTIISQFSLVLGHAAALPRGFDTAAIHCGRVLAENTARCCPRDWKFRSGHEDKSADFTVQFGIRRGSNGDPVHQEIDLFGEDQRIKAVHMEYGLSNEQKCEVIPRGFVSSSCLNDWVPDYIGAAPQPLAIIEDTFHKPKGKQFFEIPKGFKKLLTEIINVHPRQDATLSNVDKIGNDSKNIKEATLSIEDNNKYIADDNQDVTDFEKSISEYVSELMSNICGDCCPIGIPPK